MKDPAKAPHTTPGDLREAMDLIRVRVLEAVDPRRLVSAVLRNVPEGRRTDAIIAIGKAAPGMHAGAVEVLGDLPSCMITSDGTPAPGWAALADHPIPTHRNVEASRSLEAFLASRPGNLLALLSGGASALLASPAEGVSLEDLRETTRSLLAAGATIHEINAVRKHIERLKGGRLALACDAASILTLIISDVVGDDPGVIGSGPLSPDPTTYADALAVLDRCALGPSPVREHLALGARGLRPETPKPGDPAFDRVETRVIASNTTAVEAASAACDELGFRVATSGLHGEASAAGRRIARRLAAAGPGTALIFGGETTVPLGEGRAGATDAGRGGRNQELALAGAIELASHSDEMAIMALATDGVDGPTDAAGALVTPETAQRARSRGLDPEASLRSHDSHTLLDRAGALIRTGPTGTNVADIVVALRR